MSFILDALKKSESERQRQAGPALLEMRIVRPTHRLPLWAVLMGVVLILAVGVLAWLAWRPAAPLATAAIPAPASLPATAPAAASTAPPALAQAPPAAAAAAQGAFVSPALATPPATAQPPSPPAASATDANPADTEPAVTAPSSAHESSSTAGLRNYSELGGSLPELRLDLHVYAANPAERYAFINMHKVREGETTAEGVQVKEITRDGVVLDYRGTEFVLGRQ